jgi:D-glycero-D-manno-heptose 1,7-bisphosphate phosphatase
MDAILLDRDGVINVNRVDHVVSWDQFRFIPGALGALRRLRAANIPVIVVTNQAIIGRGLADVETLEQMNDRLRRVVEWAGGAITDILYCPHRPEDGCDCRKPQPGLLLEAARRHNLDLRRCAIVGDAYSDIAAGLAVGCTAAMVTTGRGLAEHTSAQSAGRGGYHLMSDLAAAVDWFLGNEQAPREMPFLHDIDQNLTAASL